MDIKNLTPPPPPPPITGFIKRKTLFFTSFILLIFCLILSLPLASCDEDDYKKESVSGLWEPIRNTAWKMDRTISDNEQTYNVTYTIGFYGPRNGPFADSYRYNPYTVIRVSSDNGPEWLPTGSYSFSNFEITISRTGGKILEYRADNRSIEFFEYGAPTNNSSFNFSVSGNTLTISGVKFGRYIKVSESLYWGLFVDEANTHIIDYNFNNFIKTFRKIGGTYTKFSDDPAYAFDEGWQEFWPKIKNTAWTKQGASTPSIGFYELNKGPSPESVDNNNYGYIYFLTPDGTAKHYISKNNNKDGLFIDSRRVSFKIFESNNTLTISNLFTPINRIDNGASYRFKFNLYDNKQYSGNPSKEYDLPQAREVFEGAYSKTPDYNWNK